MSIFVSIAAYCDPWLGFTLRSAMERARYPDQLRFGVVDQSLPERRFSVPGDLPADQITLINIDARSARGPCWARALAMSLYWGEDWFLQIDSHTLFEQDWDVSLIGKAEACRAVSEHCVVSSYPQAFDIIDGVGVPRAEPGVVLAHVVSEGGSFPPDWPALPFKPIRVHGVGALPGFHVGAGCLFADGAYVERFPYDPYLYFQGEEQALAARLFTHGWDIYHVIDLPLLHLYNTPGSVLATGERPLHWTEDYDKARSRRWWVHQSRSQARLAELLWGDDASALGIFGLGTERSLSDYAEFSGIDYQRRELAPKAFEGPWKAWIETASVEPVVGDAPDRISGDAQ